MRHFKLKTRLIAPFSFSVRSFHIAYIHLYILCFVTFNLRFPCYASQLINHMGTSTISIYTFTGEREREKKGKNMEKMYQDCVLEREIQLYCNASHISKTGNANFNKITSWKEISAGWMQSAERWPQ